MIHFKNIFNKFNTRRRCVRYKVVLDENLKDFLNQEDIVILDVRSRKEYNHIKLKKAINIPISCISNIDIDKDKKILIYCLTGVRTMKAINVLYNKGYYNLYIWGNGGLNSFKYKEFLNM